MPSCATENLPEDDLSLERPAGPLRPQFGMRGPHKDGTFETSRGSDRRAFLRGAASLAGVAMFDLSAREAPAAVPAHHAPKAKRVLQIFCPGGASHMDLWEHKPELERLHDQPMPGGDAEVTFQGKNGPLMKSPWGFSPAGQTGRMWSNLLPNMARHADDVAMVHSMTGKSNTHGPGCVFMNTGHDREGFPAAGAWASYALGSLSEDLPAFVAVSDLRGEPPNGKANWSNGFLPARHQGVMLSDHAPIRNLRRPESIDAAADEAAWSLASRLNAGYADRHPAESALAARVAAYELAARMQTSAPEAADLSREPKSVHDAYGTGDANKLKAAYARNCLLSRRLLERGVRYVSLYCASRASGADGLLNWDAHKTLKADYERHGPIFDGPTAALLDDLKSRGLLDDTLVLWTTEFGRMPTRQEGTSGRDHNPDGFTCWMMGAGVRGGATHGATDPFGRRAEVDPATVWDFYATVLHLLGFDHERLTVYHNGLDRRLTDVHGDVLHGLLS